VVNERPCIRCQHPVLLEGGHLVYCSYCGAPQIFLSEELQAEIAEEARAFQERNAPAAAGELAEGAQPPTRRWPRTASPSAQQPWSRAVQVSLFSAAVTLGLGLLSMAFAPTGFLMFLWVVLAPILTVTLYNARTFGEGTATSGFAAKMGLLTGLLVTVACAATGTLRLVLLRFVFHSPAGIDSYLSESFAQQRVLLLQRMGSSAQPTIDMFAIPEFRVGLLLTVVAASAAVYLCLSTLAAGLAGIVFRRRTNA
jgi:hypothetical protein